MLKRERITDKNVFFPRNLAIAIALLHIYSKRDGERKVKLSLLNTCGLVIT